MSYSYSRGLSWPVLLFVIVLVLILGGIVSPLFFSRKMGPHDLAKAAKNAGSVSASLLEFKRQKGFYPDQRTREMLLDDGVTDLSEGDDANAYLSQLLAAKIIDNEEVFYTPNREGFQYGDNDTDFPDLLSPGENGFAYIMAESGEALNGGSDSMPLILAPVIRGGRDPRFDSEPYGGRFVYGKADGSVSMGKIAEDGTPMPIDGVPLFETGPGTVWGDQVPVVKMPLNNSNAP